MKKEFQQQLMMKVKDFSLPRYSRLPSVGLYLEQTVKLVNMYLAPFGSVQLTSSMASNYVKKKLVESPVKKQYYQNHIAHLIFICVTKSVLSLEDILFLEEIQNEWYTTEVAYNYFCEEFENVLKFTFGVTTELSETGTTDTEVKDLFSNTIRTVADKIYTDEYISIFRAEKEGK